MLRWRRGVGGFFFFRGEIFAQTSHFFTRIQAGLADLVFSNSQVNNFSNGLQNDIYIWSMNNNLSKFPSTKVHFSRGRDGCSKIQNTKTPASALSPGAACCGEFFFFFSLSLIQRIILLSLQGVVLFVDS